MRFDQFLLTIGLAMLAAFVLGVVGFFKAVGDRRRLNGLEQTVLRLNAEVTGMSAALQRAGLRPDGSWAGAAAPVAPTAPEQATAAPPAQAAAIAPEPARPAAFEPEPAEPVPAEASPESGPAFAPPPAAPPAAPTPSLEETLALRWGVWAGATALLLAAVFLVRYAVEEGLLGPPMRCALTALLGFALIAAGEWLAQRPLSLRIAAVRSDQAPPALTAGGVAALFGAAYAASVMYALLPLVVGFLLMAAAGGLGLLLSLRRGPLVAAVGLAAAFATPALVQTENPSLPGLFVYLLVVTAAAMAVVRYTAWGWLGWSATIAGALWVLVGSNMAVGLDVWAPALFVPLAAALNLFLLPREALEDPLGQRLAFIPFTALGASLLLAIATASPIAPVIGVLLLSPVGILRARDEPRLAVLPFVAAGLGLVALWCWALPPWKPTGERIVIEGALQSFIPGAFAPDAVLPFLIIAAVLGAVHFLAGVAQETRAARPLPWAGLAASVPVLSLLFAYVRVRGFALDFSWAFAALAVCGLLVATATRAAGQGDGARAGVHAAGATAALALGVAMVLRDQWLTLAIALFLPPLTAIAARARLPALRPVALAVGAVVIVRLVMNRFVAEYDFGATPVLNGLWVAYALPAAAFAITAWLLLRERDDDYARAFEGASVLLATLFVVLQIRHGVHGGKIADYGWPFAEMALDVSALALMAFGLRWVAQAGSRPTIDIAARLVALGALGLGVLLLLLNPWTQRGVTVGQLPIFNLLLAAYAVPGLLAAWAVLRIADLKVSVVWRRAFALYALAAVFAWVTFEVWAWFHDGGRYRPRQTFTAEFWAYSAAWLALGAALLWLGIRHASRELRLAALAVLGLTTFKVFLVDMGALVGLWRVLSFLGLGLALIGLGAIYQRFVLPRPAAPQAPDQAPAAPQAPDQTTRSAS